MGASSIKRLGTAAVAAALVVTGCGSDDLDDGTSTADDDAEDAEGDAGSDDATSAASIDPATMPGPAEAVLTVDGETIMYAPPDPEDTRLFTCDLGTDAITVNMQTPDGHDLLVQVAPLDTDRWAGSIVAKSRDSERTYQGTRSYSADSFAVDGQYMVFVGPFEYSEESDRGNFVDAGEGQIAVTCP